MFSNKEKLKYLRKMGSKPAEFLPLTKLPRQGFLNDSIKEFTVGSNFFQNGLCYIGIYIYIYIYIYTHTRLCVK